MDSSNTNLNFFDCGDIYRQARDEYLKKYIPDYPNQMFRSFSLSFTISKNTTKAPLIYAILEKIAAAKVDKNTVDITITTENDYLSSFWYIHDLVYNVVRRWKSVVLKYNDIQLDTILGVSYLDDFIREKYGAVLGNYSYTDYLPKKTRAKKTVEITKVKISRTDMYGALNTVINKYIELYGKNVEVKILTISSQDKVVMIENDFIIDFRLVPSYWRQRNQGRDWELPVIMIQELTHNSLFKFNYAGFSNHFDYDNIGMDFYYFHGFHYYIKEIDHFDAVDNALPELQLRKRISDYPGEIHHLILLRMENSEGKTVYGVGNTKGAIHSFILKLCGELERKNSRSLKLNGASCLPFVENKEFVKAFLSWKGERKRWRLENKFSYFYIDKAIKDDRDISKELGSFLDAAKIGKYDSEKFGFYLKPLNKWKSEEIVYNITKKLYKDYQVIYQYRPSYLATENGNMSYDIYICGLKTAIEYQGKQHFVPVEYFGGADNFKKQQERDKLKAKLSKENGVKLVYINYWENITPDLVQQRVEK